MREFSARNTHHSVEKMSVFMFLLTAEKHNKIKTNTEPGQTINQKKCNNVNHVSFSIIYIFDVIELRRAHGGPVKL